MDGRTLGNFAEAQPIFCGKSAVLRKHSRLTPRKSTVFRKHRAEHSGNRPCFGNTGDFTTKIGRVSETQPISRTTIDCASEAKAIATGEISQMVASTPDFPREIDCVSETSPIVAPLNGSVAGALPMDAREIPWVPGARAIAGRQSPMLPR